MLSSFRNLIAFCRLIFSFPIATSSFVRLILVVSWRVFSPAHRLNSWHLTWHNLWGKFNCIQLLQWTFNNKKTTKKKIGARFFFFHQLKLANSHYFLEFWCVHHARTIGSTKYWLERRSRATHTQKTHGCWCCFRRCVDSFCVFVGQLMLIICMYLTALLPFPFYRTEHANRHWHKQIDIIFVN